MFDSSSSVPEFTGTVDRPEQVAVDILFIPVFQDDDALDDLPGLDEASGGEIKQARSSGEFRGKAYDVFVTRATGGHWTAGRLALVGAGHWKDLDVERLRRVAASCGYAARLRAVESTGFVVRAGLDPYLTAQAGA